MSYPATTIANFFIGKELTNPQTSPLTPLKLIKLVYIAHGLNLAFKNKPLIDEAVQAWRYGPVIPSLYQEFKKYGNDKITQLAEDAEGIDEHDSVTINLLNRVWEEYGHLDGLQLSSWTHQELSPWYITWQSGKGKNETISDVEIQTYYKNLIKIAQESHNSA